MTQGIETGSVTPEAVAEKPKTILQQIVDRLKLSAQGENAYLFIAGMRNAFESAELYISPLQPRLDIDGINGFTSLLLDEIRHVEGHSALFNRFDPAERLNNKGGIKFGYIRYKEEIIGKRITTEQIDFSDPLYPSGRNYEQAIRRHSTDIVIFPTTQLAEFAFALSSDDNYRVPKNFLDVWHNRGVTNEQLKLLSKVAIRPKSPRR